MRDVPRVNCLFTSDGCEPQSPRVRVRTRVIPMHVFPAPDLAALLPALRAATRGVHRQQWRRRRMERGVALAAVLKLLSGALRERDRRRAKTSSGWSFFVRTGAAEQLVARV